MVPIDYNGFWSFVYSKKTAMLMTSGKRDVNRSIPQKILALCLASTTENVLHKYLLGLFSGIMFLSELKLHILHW